MNAVELTKGNIMSASEINPSLQNWIESELDRIFE